MKCQRLEKKGGSDLLFCAISHKSVRNRTLFLFEEKSNCLKLNKVRFGIVFVVFISRKSLPERRNFLPKKLMYNLIFKEKEDEY